uniref:Uncharacterized protein n=1 Tax=viral metagenome TaxID=1070528 RepID=A0A6H1ZSS2_9ZZZZ
MNERKIRDIIVDLPLSEIVDAYAEGVEGIPTEKVKSFFREWEGRVPVKLIKQSIYAGIFLFAKRPENVDIIEIND